MSKKHKILEVATRLFMRDGYGRVSMDQVTRDSGVSKATVYAYFSGKNELFIASLEYYQQQHNVVAPEFNSETPAGLPQLLTEIKIFTQQIFAYYNSDVIVGMYRILIAEIRQFPELFQLYFGNHSGKTRMLADYLAKFAKERHISDNDCYLLACQILDLVRGATLWAKLVQNPEKIQLFVDTERAVTDIYNSIVLLINFYLDKETL